jgi:hypothetical protein
MQASHFKRSAFSHFGEWVLTGLFFAFLVTGLVAATTLMLK